VKPLRTLAALAVATLLTLSAPVLAALQLVPVVSGLTEPVFVGHAGDGTERLFIVERAGIIKVLQPGASTPSIFLDIRDLVVDGGSEQGLLGLAFHPLYESSGRFFVFYTRLGGELTIAEYHVSGNPNVAQPAGTVLLTIAHSANQNHNGGMLAFGPDGYLYIGVGDGGGANDTPNNAQNLEVLLGKILRIDVNAGAPYTIPPSNPFAGGTTMRDEIFAFGMRNPWRLSFDRDTGQLWVADVGQGQREEVNTPIVSGGNYGWRVFEGFLCTPNDPSRCGMPGFIAPLFDYSHGTGRCSITGGYVYRGDQGAVPDGTYVYGDFCTGEILGWNGAEILLLDTSLRISSFGEDEAGEIYVVNYGGSVSRLAATAPPPPPPPPPTCTYTISPARASFSSAGGPGAVSVEAPAGCPWTASNDETWITLTGATGGNGNGTVTYSVASYTGKQGVRNGRLTVAGQAFTVKQSK
jgi:hypothetical protein